MPNAASQNALPTDAASQQHERNRTTSMEKEIHARNKELNKEQPDAAVDESAGHAGMSARVAAWLRYGHGMLTETVVVHNVKTTAEWLSVAAFFERHRQRIVQHAGVTAVRPTSTARPLGRHGRSAKHMGGANARADAASAWTVRMRPSSELQSAKYDYFRMIGFPPQRIQDLMG